MSTIKEIEDMRNGVVSIRDNDVELIAKKPYVIDYLNGRISQCDCDIRMLKHLKGALLQWKPAGLYSEHGRTCEDCGTSTGILLHKWYDDGKERFSALCHKCLIENEF